jgi:hypothetical protein
LVSSGHNSLNMQVNCILRKHSDTCQRVTGDQGLIWWLGRKSYQISLSHGDNSLNMQFIEKTFRHMSTCNRMSNKQNNVLINMTDQNTSTKHNKYAVNQQFEYVDDISSVMLISTLFCLFDILLHVDMCLNVFSINCMFKLLSPWDKLIW